MYEITKPAIDIIMKSVVAYLAEMNAEVSESDNMKWEEKEILFKQISLAGSIICMCFNLRLGESITRVADDVAWPIWRAED